MIALTPPPPSSQKNRATVQQFVGSSRSPTSSKSEIEECHEHPSEVITNFCSCLECLLPLCPECVTIHNLQHRQQGSYAEIETIRSVKHNCEEKLSSAISLLTSQIINCENALLVQSEVYNESFACIRKQRKRVDELLDTHFNQLEENLLNNTRKLKERTAPINVIFDRMRQAMVEFKGISSELSARTNMETLQRVCGLDVQQVLAKFKGEINRISQSISSEPALMPTFDEGRLFNFAQELERVAQLKPCHVPDPFSSNSVFLATATNTNADFKQQQQQHSPDAALQYQQSQQQHQQQQKQLQPQQQQQQQPQQKQPKQHPHHISSPPPSSSSHNKYHLTEQSSPSPIHQHPLPPPPPNAVDQSAPPISVKFADFFDKIAARKYLHFFQNDENKLHYITLSELEQISSQYSKPQHTSLPSIFHTITLNISFRIPSFHKSIAIPSGELFITGGTLQDPAMNKSGQIFQFDWTSHALIPLGNMSVPRSSHGVSFLNGKIYVVGGYENRHVMSKRCERFNLQTKRWETIASLNHAATSLALCSFNNRALFKFGGIGDGDENYFLSPYIERYDVFRDVWELIDPKLSDLTKASCMRVNFSLLSTSAAVQISDNEIFVFGGYHEDNTGSNQSFILAIEHRTQSIVSHSTQQQSGASSNVEYSIRNINARPLPISEGFWNNQPIVHSKKVFALQNLPGENSDNCLENERTVAVFDAQWKHLN